LTSPSSSAGQKGQQRGGLHDDAVGERGGRNGRSPLRADDRAFRRSAKPYCDSDGGFY